VDERVCDHVINCMAMHDKRDVSEFRLVSEQNSLAVGKVSERALLVDDADSSLLRADAHALDVVRRLAERLEPLMHDVRGLDGRLRVELGWV
jgi:hypothetical protein